MGHRYIPELLCLSFTECHSNRNYIPIRSGNYLQYLVIILLNLVINQSTEILAVENRLISSTTWSPTTVKSSIFTPIHSIDTEQLFASIDTATDQRKCIFPVVTMIFFFRFFLLLKTFVER